MNDRVTDGVSERESERMSLPAGARAGARVSTRLFVTGLGLVTPLGPNAEVTWSRLVRGDRAIRPITLFDPAGQRASFAAEVGDVDLPAGPRDVTAAWSRTSAMAMSAAGEAMRMAGLRPGGAGTRRVGLVVGGTTGGMFETERLLARLHAEPSSREVLAGMLSHPLTAATGDRLDERLGPFCRVRIALECVLERLECAHRRGGVRRSRVRVDAVVAGEATGLCRLTLTGFNAIAAIESRAVPALVRSKAPRNDFLGEGAGFLVLEREESARARVGHQARGRSLAGWGSRIRVASHHVNLDPDGAGRGRADRASPRAIRVCPRGMSTTWNAHGTGHFAN